MPDEKVIRASKNGPYLIPGSLLLVDEDGNPTENTRKMVALCRWGGSKTKPYCERTQVRAAGLGVQAVLAGLLLRAFPEDVLVAEESAEMLRRPEATRLWTE